MDKKMLMIMMMMMIKMPKEEEMEEENEEEEEEKKKKTENFVQPIITIDRRKCTLKHIYYKCKRREKRRLT